MKLDKKIQRLSVAAVAVGILAVGAVASAAPGGKGKGGGKKPPKPPATTVVTTTPETTTPATSTPPPPPDTTNNADAEFVAMMIPHHFQATVMGDLALDRAGDADVLALADRIGVEQTVEIGMMQNWQSWNGFDITDAEAAYQMMLGMPMMLEQMGMASPAEIDELTAASGTDFDSLYLELMIDHHEGAVTMLVNVLTHGTDTTLEFWATDMLTAQTHQIYMMEEMLAGLG